MTDAPTTRETADHADHIGDAAAMIDHAELARLCEQARDATTVWTASKALAAIDAIVSPDYLLALLSEVAALRGEVERSLPSISFDGEHAISDHRRWLARQLLDSKLDDGEAYSIVAYHPAITDLRTTQAERQRDEALEALRAVDHAARTAASMAAANYTISAEALGEKIYNLTTPLIPNQGADQ